MDSILSFMPSIPVGCTEKGAMPELPSNVLTPDEAAEFGIHSRLRPPFEFTVILQQHSTLHLFRYVVRPPALIMRPMRKTYASTGLWN